MKTILICCVARKQVIFSLYLVCLLSYHAGLVTLRLCAGGGLRCFHCGLLPQGPGTPAPCTSFHPRHAQADCGPGEVCVALSLPGDEEILTNSVLNVKVLVGAFNQEKAIVGAFSVITNLWMDLFEALVHSPVVSCLVSHK